LNQPFRKLLIVSRDALLDATQRPTGAEDHGSLSERIFRSLANISRHGCHLLLTASEPDKWVPTRGTVDDALARQNMLVERVRAAGGEVDGIYYVARSLLTQDRNREGALRDILKRYSLEPEAATLVSSSVPFIKAAERLGMSVFEIVPPGKRGKKLETVLRQIDAA